MNFEPKTLNGYRPTSIRKESKEIRTKYLELSEHANAAYADLRQSVKENGANCEGRTEEFSGATLPTAEWAERECLGCASRTSCALFLKIGRPSYGVFDGKVVDSFPHLNEGEDND